MRKYQTIRANNSERNFDKAPLSSHKRKKIYKGVDQNKIQKLESKENFMKNTKVFVTLNAFLFIY